MYLMAASASACSFCMALSLAVLPSWLDSGSDTACLSGLWGVSFLWLDLQAPAEAQSGEGLVVVDVPVVLMPMGHAGKAQVCQ